MKKMTLISVALLTMAFASSASATPFADYQGDFYIVNQICYVNTKPVVCDAEQAYASIVDNGASATVSLDGKKTHMESFNYSGEEYDHTWARFYSDAATVSWNYTHTIGDVSSHMVRTSKSVKIEQGDNYHYAFVMTISSSNMAGINGTSIKRIYFLSK